MRTAAHNQADTGGAASTERTEGSGRGWYAFHHYTRAVAALDTPVESASPTYLKRTDIKLRHYRKGPRLDPQSPVPACWRPEPCRDRQLGPARTPFRAVRAPERARAHRPSRAAQAARGDRQPRPGGEHAGPVGAARTPADPAHRDGMGGRVSRPHASRRRLRRAARRPPLSP